MRIECTEERISDMDADTGQHYQMSKGDILTVPDAYGARLCSYGWVKDVDGNVPSAERKPGAQELRIDKATIGSKARVR